MKFKHFNIGKMEKKIGKQIIEQNKREIENGTGYVIFSKKELELIKEKLYKNGIKYYIKLQLLGNLNKKGFYYKYENSKVSKKTKRRVDKILKENGYLSIGKKRTENGFFINKYFVKKDKDKKIKIAFNTLYYMHFGGFGRETISFFLKEFK